MKAVILAAGYATRLWPLTKDRPKALLPIGRKLMLDYLADEMETIPELDEAWIVTNHRFAGQFEDWVRARGGRVRYSVVDDGTEDNEHRLGALGDLQFVIDLSGIDDDLLVAASDNLFCFSLNDMAELFRTYREDTILARRMTDPEYLRRVAVAELDAAGHVCALEEKPVEPKGELGVFAVYLYRRETLPMLKQYLEEGNVPDSPGNFPAWLYQRRPVRCFVTDHEIEDIGTIESYYDVVRRMTGNGPGLM